MSDFEHFLILNDTKYNRNGKEDIRHTLFRWEKEGGDWQQDKNHPLINPGLIFKQVFTSII